MQKKASKKETVAKFKLKVGTAERYEDIDARETRIRVPFEITDASTTKGAVVMRHIESFPLATPAKEIRETLKRHLDVFIADRERHEANKERDAAVQQSQKAVEDISNLVIE
jgi:hypothetical protein